METTEQQSSGPEVKTMTQDIIIQQQEPLTPKCCHTEGNSCYFDLKFCCPKLVNFWQDCNNPEYLRAFEKEHCCNENRCCYCGPKNIECCCSESSGGVGSSDDDCNVM